MLCFKSGEILPFPLAVCLNPWGSSFPVRAPETTSTFKSDAGPSGRERLRPEPRRRWRSLLFSQPFLWASEERAMNLTMRAGQKFPIVSLAVSATSLFLDGWDQSMGSLAVWRDHQIKNEGNPMPAGPAMPFVRKLLALNQYSLDPEKQPFVQAHVISRQDPCVALRFLNSLEHHDLHQYFDSHLVQCYYLGGGDPVDYLGYLGVHLYLSGHEQPVRKALEAGVAAALIAKPTPPVTGSNSGGEKLVVAFDGDAVIFDRESDERYASRGREEALQTEFELRHKPLSHGPLQGFFMALCALRSVFPQDPVDSPLHILLATARGFKSQHRVFTTFKEWGVRLDRAFFVSGKEKGPCLRASHATILFDDAQRNIESAQQHGVPGAHIPLPPLPALPAPSPIQLPLKSA